MKAVFLFLFLLLTVPANATVYWAHPSGNNAAACASIDSVAADSGDPGSYGTINRAAQCAQVAGDIINIKAGTYTGTNHTIHTFNNCTGNCMKSGTSESVRTIVQGAPGEARPQINIPNWFTIYDDATSTRSYITIRNLNVDGEGGNDAGGSEISPGGSFITVENVFTSSPFNMNVAVFRAAGSTRVHHIIVRNSKFQGQQSSTARDGNGYCIYLNADDVLIENNECYDQLGGGFQIYQDNVVSSPRAIIRYNYLHDFRNATQANVEGQCYGIAVDGANDQIYGNILDGTTCTAPGGGGKYGLQITGSTTLVYNNLIYGWIADGIEVSGSSGHVARNNIVFGNGLGIQTYNGASLAANEFNACSAAQSCGSSKITISALTDITVSTTNFRHKAGSLGINAGTTSLRGCNGQCDLGPFETFTYSSATVNENNLDVTVGMSVFTPIQPASGMTTMTALVGGVARTTVSADKLTGTDSQIRIVFNGAVCAGGETWTVTHAVGNITDSAAIGGSSWANLNQPMTAFTAQAVTNNCGAAPPSDPGTPYIYYKLNETVGTTIDDEQNNHDGTASNATVGVTGKHSFAVSFTNDTTDRNIAIGYGSGVNPTTQSLTICMGVKPDSGLETGAQKIFFSTNTTGTDQRFYMGWVNGFWGIGIQTSSFSTASDRAVAAGWSYVCLVANSGTDTATLYVNGTVTSSVKSYTSFTLANNFRIGNESSFSINYGGSTIDEFKLYQSALTANNIADLYQIWEQTSPAPTGTFDQKTHRFRKLRVDGSGNPITLGTVGASIRVVPGAAFEIEFQTDCTGADCSSTGQRLRYNLNSGSYTELPDSFGTDLVAFYGTTTDTSILTGTITCCLTGALTANDGTTNFTAAAVPVVDLTLNSSVVQRYVVKLSPSVSVGSVYCFRLYDQSGNALDTYTTTPCATVETVSLGIGF